MMGLSGIGREENEAACYFEVSLGDQYADVPKESCNQS